MGTLWARTFYLSGTSQIVGDAQKEAKLMSFLKEKQVKQLNLYETHLFWNRIGDLARFISHLQKDGGQKVYIVGDHSHFFRKILELLSAESVQVDGICLEREFWNQRDRKFSEVLAIVKKMKELALDYKIKTSVYLGYPSSAELSALAQEVDQIYLHSYVPVQFGASAKLVFQRLVQRLAYLKTTDKKLEIYALLSTEDRFMGRSLQTMDQLLDMEEGLNNLFQSQMLDFSPQVSYEGVVYYSYGLELVGL